MAIAARRLDKRVLDPRGSGDCFLGIEKGECCADWHNWKWIFGTCHPPNGGFSTVAAKFQASNAEKP